MPACSSFPCRDTAARQAQGRAILRPPEDSRIHPDPPHSLQIGTSDGIVVILVPGPQSIPPTGHLVFGQTSLYENAAFPGTLQVLLEVRETRFPARSHLSPVEVVSRPRVGDDLFDGHHAP